MLELGLPADRLQSHHDQAHEFLWTHMKMRDKNRAWVSIDLALQCSRLHLESRFGKTMNRSETQCKKKKISSLRCDAMLSKRLMVLGSRLK